MALLQCLLFALCVKFTTQTNFIHTPEQGIFKFTLTSDKKMQRLTKILYNQTTINIKVSTTSSDCTTEQTVQLQWLIRGSTCRGEYMSEATDVIQGMMYKPNMKSSLGAEKGMYLSNYVSSRPGSYSGGDDLECKKVYTLKLFDKKWKDIEKSSSSDNATEPLPTALSRKQRESENDSPVLTNKKDAAVNENGAKVPFMGEYIVIIFIDDGITGVSFDVVVDMHSPVGYLSAHEYPLLTFYMVMCIIYVLYTLVWLFLSARNYQELLRIQFWISGVILLGMIEKAVHYAEFRTVNSTGISTPGIEKFAEIVSAMKRAVARMLVIIVSLGFGIVKPRLGPMLYRVIGVGVLYFVLAVLESMIRIDAYFHPATKEAWMLMYIPLAVLDAVICWWIFISLLQTMKTLRLRRNVVKLSLYRHFSNTIVFCIAVSILMMVWSIYIHKKVCFSDFKNLWLESAGWHILFSVILLVIMILWRPNANSQRYAYSPMTDGNDSDNDETEEPMLKSGATENMKMRGTGKYSSVKSDTAGTEEELKWIEDNIPQTVADAALPALLDSDEEAMATKYEMSKRE